MPLVFEEMRRREEFAPARSRLIDCDLLHDPARAGRHHEDSIAGVDSLVNIMRDENDGPAELLMDFQQIQVNLMEEINQRSIEKQ